MSTSYHVPRTATRLGAWAAALGLSLVLTSPVPAADDSFGVDVAAAPAAGRVEIGGSVTAVTHVDAFGAPWVLYNTSNHLHASLVSGAIQRVYDTEVEGFIRDVLVVDYAGRKIALLAMGSEGLAAVDVTDPRTMTPFLAVTVNYLMDGVTWTEGGGDIVPDNTVQGSSGFITSLASDGVDLWIGDEDFGIHRTTLDALLALTGPTLEPDGSLWIDHETWTLQYAGENPWGGPRDLVLHDGLLYAAQGFLGVGVYDPATLERLGGWNLYTDASVVEDWFIDMDVADEVQPGFLDAVTGMPDYRQASFEILEVWHGGVVAPTPWADFDRYGRYYYNTNAVAVADFGPRTLVYLAAGLGGVVAVEQHAAGPGLAFEYLGYAPGVPAHGPDKPTMGGGEPDGGSLFPHHGAGMLKEAGAVDVAVSGDTVLYTDHFAGLVVLRGADDPAANWRGPDAPYDNDDPTLGDGVLGDHWPDDEFVTSYDMDPYDPADHESLPVWMYGDPSLLVTGEVNGHGGPFHLLPAMDPTTPGIDLALSAGAGGLGFLDLRDLAAPAMGDRWSMEKSFATTTELGARPGASPFPVSIGHTEGVAASDRYLYVADGPHGVSAWRLAFRDGSPVPELHLVANTLQDEYPVEVGGTTVYPTPHAHNLVLDETDDTLFVMCRSLGVRRVDVSGVEAGVGKVGAPLLLTPAPTDLFEHNTESGSVDGLPKQDSAMDMVRVGELAFVADGNNGLTVYDLTKDPTDLQSGFVVSNLGGSAMEKAELGRATGIASWVRPALGMAYAFVAAGPRGVGVVDVSDPSSPVLVKVFEPIKIEDDKVGKADGRAVDVEVRGRFAYFTYDSFGVLAYSLRDLVAPLPPGVEPTKIWSPDGAFDHRPEALARFKLSEIPGYEEVSGGALGLTMTQDGPVVLHVAYGTAGVATILWNDPANPALLELRPTPGEANAVALRGARMFVADGAGGLVFFE